MENSWLYFFNPEDSKSDLFYNGQYTEQIFHISYLTSSFKLIEK